jgi:hypothetical protein
VSVFVRRAAVAVPAAILLGLGVPLAGFLGLLTAASGGGPQLRLERVDAPEAAHARTLSDADFGLFPSALQDAIQTAIESGRAQLPIDATVANALAKLGLPSGSESPSVLLFRGAALLAEVTTHGSALRAAGEAVQGASVRVARAIEDVAQLAR